MGEGTDSDGLGGGGTERLKCHFGKGVAEAAATRTFS